MWRKGDLLTEEMVDIFTSRVHAKYITNQCKLLNAGLSGTPPSLAYNLMAHGPPRSPLLELSQALSLIWWRFRWNQN